MIFTFVSVGKHEECLCIELLFQPLPLLIFEQNISLGMREIFVLEYTQYIRRTDGSWSSRIVRIFLSEGQSIVYPPQKIALDLFQHLNEPLCLYAGLVALQYVFDACTYSAASKKSCFLLASCACSVSNFSNSVTMGESTRRATGMLISFPSTMT